MNREAARGRAGAANIFQNPRGQDPNQRPRPDRLSGSAQNRVHTGRCWGCPISLHSHLHSLLHIRPQMPFLDGVFLCSERCCKLPRPGEGSRGHWWQTYPKLGHSCWAVRGCVQVMDTLVQEKLHRPGKKIAGPVCPAHVQFKTKCNRSKVHISNSTI